MLYIGPMQVLCSCLTIFGQGLVSSDHIEIVSVHYIHFNVLSSATHNLTVRYILAQVYLIFCKPKDE